jgi:molecular chaperone GrpE
MVAGRDPLARKRVLMMAHDAPLSSVDLPFADTSAPFTKTAPADAIPTGEDGSPTVTAETVAPSLDPLAQAEAKYKDLHDQHLRLAADFDNFRKRRLQELDHSRKFGAEPTLLALLPVLDNLHRAQSSLTEASDPKVLLQSITLLQRQLIDTLATLGLTPLEAKGQLFDPNCHEAISSQPSADVPEETVLQVAQEGYKLHERVIRPAQVIVATAVEPASPSTPQSANPFMAS